MCLQSAKESCRLRIARQRSTSKVGRLARLNARLQDSEKLLWFVQQRNSATRIGCVCIDVGTREVVDQKAMVRHGVLRCRPALALRLRNSESSWSLALAKLQVTDANDIFLVGTQVAFAREV